MSKFNRPVRVLIIGAGPAGFYTVEELGKRLKTAGLESSFDIINRDIRPGGLLVYGVAPDHPKIRAVGKVFDKILQNENVRYFGNVSVGKDITLEELRPHYDVIVFSVGAQSDKPLGVPGEKLGGSLSAREFVAWYNGDPDYIRLNPSLEHDTAFVIGAGNVAADVARVLAKTYDELRQTDLAPEALEELGRSKVKRIVICVRRGPAHVKFTPAELRDLGDLENADVIVDPKDLVVDTEAEKAMAEDKDSAKNFEIFKEFASRTPAGKPRQIEFLFMASPKELTGSSRVEQISYVKNEFQGSKLVPIAGSEQKRPTGLVLVSVGYQVIPLPGLPYDEKNSVIANNNGKVLGDNLGGVYVVGWAADGPTGIIGTNKTRAKKVSDQIAADIESIQPATDPRPEALEGLLRKKGIRAVTQQDWLKIETEELAKGKATGRPRVRFTANQQMLGLLS